MIIRESEAKTKRCPHSRVANDQKTSVAINRADSTRCLASGCMAWRRVQRTEAMGSEPIEFGYCGLAGKPEAE